MKYWLVILGTLATGWLGSWLTGQGLDWYYRLRLPALAPGGGVIGGIWTLIYLLAAVALILWLAQSKRGANYYWVVWWFGINAILNVGWSYLWFVKHLIGPAIAEMVVLEATVILLIWLMWKRVRTSAWLLLPYAVWVLFATYLAYSVWVLNR